MRTVLQNSLLRYLSFAVVFAFCLFFYVIRCEPVRADTNCNEIWQDACGKGKPQQGTKESSCPSGQTKVGCFQNQKGVIIGICCVENYQAGTEGNAECTTESVVECWVNNKPSSEGLSSYKCVSIGTCKGTDLGLANCKQGVGGAMTCCSIPKCAGAKQTTAASSAVTPAQIAKPKTGQVFSVFNPLGKTTSIPEIMGKVINMFLGIVGAIALAVFVYGGVMWMTARGNSKQADSARGAIVNAVIGLVIIGFSYTLATSVITMLTTVQVPPPERLPAEQQTVAETEQAGEQQSVQQQKAEEQQAKEAGSQSVPAVSCAPGRTCVDLTCQDKTIYSQCWAAGCSGTQVCCPTTLVCPTQ